MSGSKTKPDGFWVAGSSEVRRHYRRAVNDIALGDPVSGRLLDISEAGMGVRTSRPLAVRTRIDFVLESRTGQQSFLGEIRWCRLIDTIPLPHGESATVYRSGIAFVTA